MAAEEKRARGSTPSASTPRISALFGSSSWRAHPVAIGVLLVGLAISIGAFLVAQARERQASRIAFERRANRTLTAFRANLERPLEVLRTLPALFEASDQVTRAEFKIFVQAALSRHPDILALVWMPRVQATERMAFEDAARREGLPAFQITELRNETFVRAGDRAEYFPIFYVQPAFPALMGFDEASEPVREEALSRARDSGAPAASRKTVVLGDAVKVAGTIVFVPIYTTGTVPTSVEARRAALRGFVVEVFRFASVFEGVRKVEDLHGLELKLVDATDPHRPEVLHETRDATLPVHSPDFASTSVTLPFGGRSWSLVVSGPVPVAAIPYAVLAAGVLLSVLLAAGTLAIATILKLRRRMREEFKLGPFTLVEKLGEGGMGVVYKAKHALLKRPTAVKLVRLGQENGSALHRFEREVQLTSSLSHPNTIAVYDYDRTPDGVFYYAMEYIDGITLEQLVERTGALPPGRVTRILRQVAGALAEAHAIGLIHRDIKPANIMISRRGGLPDFVKVLDFGLVRSITSGGPTGIASTVTQATAFVGTPLYLAPESISSSGEIDGRADLYALGAVAYLLLTGEPVFRGRTVVEICGHHLHTTPEPPSARAPEPVPVELETIVLCCLEKSPEKRFASAAELLAALERLAEAGVTWSDAVANDWWSQKGDALVLSVRADTSARVSEPLTVGGR